MRSAEDCCRVLLAALVRALLAGLAAVPVPFLARLRWKQRPPEVLAAGLSDLVRQIRFLLLAVLLHPLRRGQCPLLASAVELLRAVCRERWLLWQGRQPMQGWVPLSAGRSLPQLIPASCRLGSTRTFPL